MRINGKSSWIFKINRDESIVTGRIKGVVHDSTRLKIVPVNEQSCLITIKAGMGSVDESHKPFAWDGCTPKWSIMDIVVGTPDGVVDIHTEKPKTYYGSLFHDALYQFAPRDIITRKQADLIMLDKMTETSYRPRSIYYAFIRLMGGFWWNKRARRWRK